MNNQERTPLRACNMKNRERTLVQTFMLQSKKGKKSLYDEKCST
jgi:hypothetical protein